MAYSRIKESTTSTSSATITLGGAQVGYLPFSKRHAVGETNIEVVVDDGVGNWLEGVYTLTDATTLTRTAILSSSNNDGDVTFTGSSKAVFETATGSSLRRGLVNPDDAGFDIILCAGQSNMCGRGTIDTLVEVASPRIWQFGCTSGNARYQTIFSGQEPSHLTEGLNAGVPNQTGPLTAFARAYIDTIPTNRKVLLVPVAFGGTSLYGGTPRWNAGSPGGDLYEAAISQANLAITAAQALYPASRFVGVIWHQGEADALNGVFQNQYAPALKAVFAGFRSRITGAASSWAVIGGMVPEAIATGGQYPGIDLAHKQVASETAKCVFVAGPSGCTADNLHYNLNGGWRILGIRYALAVKSAQFATGVDTTAPTFVSAQVANSDPTKILVTMSEALANVVPVNSAWTVSGSKTVTASSISGAVITLTCSAAYAYGDAITVQYTKPGSGNMIQDSATTPNITASFGPSSVTNNIAAPATVPGAPTGVTASAGNAQATVSFTAPASNGGATITGYMVTASTGQTATGSASPITVTGLTNGTQVTFTVHATNSVGNSVESSASGSVTPATTTAPGAPTIGTATAGNASASVAFTAPGSTGGSAITGYTATSTPGGFTGTGASSPISVTGLTNGTAYTFTVHATNAIGSSAESAASNSVTPSTGTSMSLTSMGFMGATGTAGVYQGTTGGFWGAEGYSTMNLAFQNGIDGEFVVQMLDAPKHVSDSTGREIGIGVDAVSSAGAAKFYDVIDYFMMHRPDACVTYINSASQTPDSGGGAVVAAQNDYVRCKRVGSTLAFAVSHDAGGSYTTVKTFTGVPTTALFAHVNVLWTTSVKLISATGLA